jgi:hypothetical protein
MSKELNIDNVLQNQQKKQSKIKSADYRRQTYRPDLIQKTPWF